MKTKMIIDKTVVLTVKGGSVPVSSLTQEIQNEVMTLDRIRQDYMDTAYELEKLQLAVNGKLTQIANAIEASMKANDDVQNIVQ